MANDDVRVTPIAMIVAPAYCAICGEHGDCWNYGKVETITPGVGAYWNGVVCTTCALDIERRKKYKRMEANRQENKRRSIDTLNYTKETFPARQPELEFERMYEM